MVVGQSVVGWSKVKVEVKTEVEAKTESEEGEVEKRGGDRDGGERRQLVGLSVGWWLVCQRWKQRWRWRRARGGGQGQGQGSGRRARTVEV